jgi:hypothetical protein
MSKRSAGTILVAVLVALASAGGLALFTPTAPAPGAVDDAARLAWGIYQIYWRPDQFARQLDRQCATIAAVPDYVMFYRDLGRPFPARACRIVADRGAVPIVSLELGLWHAPRARMLPRIIAGEYDDYFRTWAVAARAHAEPVLLRFGFEFNGDWFSWAGRPAEFTAAWRRAHAIFSDAGAANVAWVWAANMTSVPDTPENAAHRYYPGNDVVDWVAVDGYNWGDGHDAWHPWARCQDALAPMVTELAARYPEKRLMVAEFASCPGRPGEKARWIREAHRWLTEETAVEAAIWFNYDKRGEGEHDWRIASSPESLAAFAETFAAQPVSR